MNKIIIVGWSVGINYGTQLQAYALYKYLSQQYGNIYQVRWMKGQGRLFQKSSLSFIYHSIRKSATSRSEKIREDKARIFVKEHLRYERFLTAFKFIFISKDSIFITASDQLWNPYVFDEKNFLAFVPERFFKMSYATSLGVNQIPNLLLEKYIKYLSRFSRLSVREMTANRILTDILGREIQTVIDPTLLLNGEEWNKLVDSENDLYQEKGNEYILGYFIDDKYEFEELLNWLKNELQMELIVLYGNKIERRSFSQYLSCGPTEFLHYLKDAKYVVTNSFHCISLAISFHKQFVALPRFLKDDINNQDSRIEDLLELLKIEGHRIFEFENAYTNIIPLLGNQIDYDVVDNIVLKERCKAKQFIKEAIESSM